ncbi:MAG TPA: AAA family ATPase [Candidatus Binatia bacterium]|nr:AAA family ATPase [Candidatus Binatia bacterium]
MSIAPGAAVTFLFTDIEASTRLWQEHPDTMPAALARHDALVRDAVEHRAGRVFKHTGDGVCAVFADPADALAAAVALQRALAAAPWANGPRPRVRVALDSGSAHERDGDYFGPTLNRTARILAVGAGDQIVATAATIGGAPGADGIDLGLHRLRDLGEPVHLYQVVAPDLPRAFPPLRTLERFRHSLPVVRSSFVGREAETARLRELLASRRFVTVTGVGGCGKTRLALAAAAHDLERFPDGVYFVDLSIVSEPGLVWPAIAEAVGAGGGGDPTSSGLPARELVLGRLSAATALVMLDNCEHLLDAAAEAADALVARCAAVRILATSREPLGIEDEQVLRVPSMRLPADASDAVGAEAVRLFVERATAADAAFALTPGIVSTVVEICRRLDGIPLAIELAAARVRHLSPEEIARRLDDRFRLLTGGPRGARQRQQTLAAALDWSHQLLGARERTLLRRCAVFVDGFSLAAAEGVCAGDGLARAEVVDALAALVDKSLVSLHATEHRYRLLETIRLYAEERLVEAGEAHAVRTRHMTWFQDTYDVSRGEGSYRSEERENLKAARVWAHEIKDGTRVALLCRALFWQSGPYDPATLEERTWSETALAYGDLPVEVRAETLAIASLRAIGAGDWRAAVDRAENALALSAAPGEGAMTAAYVSLAIGEMVTDPDAAERAIDEGIRRIGEARAPFFSAPFLRSFKVGTALMRGDARSAAERGRQSIAELGRMLRGFGRAYALHLLGDHEDADADAAAGTRDPQDPFFGEHSRHLLFALTAAARGRFADARRELAIAVGRVRRYPYPLTPNDCAVVAGALAALEGRLERACVLLAAVVDRSFVRTPEMWAVYLHYRAKIRAGLDADTIRRCRDEAGTIDLDRALDEEIARDPPA